MFHFGADAGLGFFQLLTEFTPGAVHCSLGSSFAWAQGDVPWHACRIGAPFSALVAGVREDFALLTMQQAVALGDVICVGRPAHDGVYQPGIRIDSDVGFHAEAPLVALFGLVHLRVALGAASRWHPPRCRS